MKNCPCVVLAAHKHTRERIRDWLAQLDQECTFVDTAEDLLTHPQLDACPLVVTHINKRPVMC